MRPLRPNVGVTDNLHYGLAEEPPSVWPLGFARGKRKAGERTKASFPSASTCAQKAQAIAKPTSTLPTRHQTRLAHYHNARND
jgi:hypothetical protein